MDMIDKRKGFYYTANVLWWTITFAILGGMVFSKNLLTSTLYGFVCGVLFSISYEIFDRVY